MMEDRYGMDAESWQGKHFSFFSNTDCEFFPCHKTDDPDNFNCLFCFCPLYAFGDSCGGNYTLTDAGVHDCSSCMLPHRQNSYGTIMQRLSFLNEHKEGSLLDIAIIRFPGFANKCDFSILEATSSMMVRFVREPSMLGDPDLIIIPGSTSTISDMLWMRMVGLEDAVCVYASQGKPVFGICGGYQMLGTNIIDASDIEHGGSIKGMGLLPVETIFSDDERRTHTKAHTLTFEGILAPLSNLAISGYEMHHGQSRRAKTAKPLCILEDGSEEGCMQGNIYGTYLHGFFDQPACRDALVSALANMRCNNESER